MRDWAIPVALSIRAWTVVVELACLVAARSVVDKVLVALGVKVGVGVLDAVNVNDGVNVILGVNVMLGVNVCDGVGVMLGVEVLVGVGEGEGKNASKT